jgi:hypothetical protein
MKSKPRQSKRSTRRTFLKAVAPSSNAAVLPRREFGKTGIQLSIVGMGGIVVSGAEPDHAKRIVAEFVERGVNYFDVAPTYGNAEEVELKTLAAKLTPLFP